MGIKTKRGVFFSLDALIALSIIFFFILFTFPLVKQSRYQTEVHQDIIETLSSLKASEVDNAYMKQLISDGVIKDSSKSVLEVIGELYITDKALAHNLADSLLLDLESKDNIGIWYNNILIASKNKTAIENAQDIDTTRQIISGIKEGNGTTGFAARAFLTNTLQTKYAYFGGYVGDGNLSIITQYNGTIRDASMEVAINKDFTLLVNNISQGNFAASSSITTPAIYQIPLTNFHTGTNTIEIKGDALYVAGGFVKITYQSDIQYQQPIRYYFPGVRGAVNIYDSFYVPGQLSALNAYIHYQSPYNMFLTIGNTNVFSNASLTETSVTLTNTDLSSKLTYSSLSQKTIPLRLGLENVSLNGSGIGEFDVVLITDTSGSMDWRLDQDTSGTARNCNDPLLFNPTTKRISLAKCLDKDFAATIIAASPNSRVALVSFASDSTSYLTFTRNQTLLNNTINNYGASGSTCVSCALNRAYLLLQSDSNSSRKKYIVTMTDGVTNRRSTNTCVDIFAESDDKTSFFAGGQSGTLLKKSTLWNNLTSPTSNQINDIEFQNQTLGFAVGVGGTILRWDNSSWSTITSPVATDLNGLDFFNNTFTLAVGASGRVLRWNSTGWSTLATISNSPNLNDVLILNKTLIFITGDRSSRGRIFKSTNGGTTWTEDYTGGSPSGFHGIANTSTTRVFVVGDNGDIIQWSSNTWSAISSPITHDLYGIESKNSTFAIAVGGDPGNSRTIIYNGASWSSSLSVTADPLHAIRSMGGTTYALGEGATLFSYSNSAWQREFKVKPAYEGTSASGVTCTADDDSCSATNSYPYMNANFSACRAYNDLGATIFSIGFGPIATCSFANITLQSIATCGNGSFYSSNNASELQKFYSSIAQTIIQVSFAQQTVQILGNGTAIIFPDSYIEFTYPQPQNPYGLQITTEKMFTNTTSGTFNIPQSTSVLEARVLSYSGPKWTDYLRMNNNTIFDLSTYGSDYLKIGDPYIIQIPTSLIQPSNNITLTTALSPTNRSPGSVSDKIITTLLKNASGYSPISAFVEGCNWTIEFDSGTNATIPIPSNYSGVNVCSFTSGSQSYDNNDAAQTAVFRLLQALDLNGNSKVDITLAKEDISITLTELGGIPFPWWTEVQVRVWR